MTDRSYNTLESDIFNLQYRSPFFYGPKSFPAIDKLRVEFLKYHAPY